MRRLNVRLIAALIAASTLHSASTAQAAEKKKKQDFANFLMGPTDGPTNSSSVSTYASVGKSISARAVNGAASNYNIRAQSLTPPLPVDRFHSARYYLYVNRLFFLESLGLQGRLLSAALSGRIPARLLLAYGERHNPGSTGIFLNQRAILANDLRRGIPPLTNLTQIR